VLQNRRVQVRFLSHLPVDNQAKATSALMRSKPLLLD
jgi:hypothetical protein